MKYVIGIDLGTSGVKAILLSDKGEIVASKSSSYQPDFLPKGFVEQEPIVWWEHTKKVLNELVSSYPDAKDNLVSIACSGQMHSSVFLDKDGKVIRPSILWNDTRTTEQTKEIYNLCGGEKNVLSMAYNRALEGFTLPKILWLRKNERENFDKVCKVIMPKDYINYMLTGNIFTDVSDAAGTLLFDVKNRCWSTDMLDKVNLSKDILPVALESTGLVGTVSPEIAKEIGVSINTKVIAGGADNSCAGIGNGVVSKGEAVISVGTSGTVVAFLEDINSEVTGDVHLFNYSYPNSNYAMGCMLCAGQSLNWLKENILKSLSFEDLNVYANNSPVGSNNLIFLPYLFGERSPYSDPNARGVFFGLSSTTSDGDMARAVMEGVAFGLKDMFLLVEKFTDMKEIYITGGGAKSKLWGQIISDIINRDLIILNVEEGPAFGAALIACVGGEIFANFKEGKEICTKKIATLSPIKENVDKYKKIHELYVKLYKANKDLFVDLKNL